MLVDGFAWSARRSQRLDRRSANNRQYPGRTSDHLPEGLVGLDWAVMLREMAVSGVLALLPCLVSCSSEEGDEGEKVERCEYKERGTEFAPCKKDSDCYSGFCDETGNPGPYCWASSSALAQGRGIACSSDDDCPLLDYAAELGIRGVCGGSNIAQNYCGYVCKPQTAGGGAANAGGTSNAVGGKAGDAGSTSTGNTGGTGGD